MATVVDPALESFHEATQTWFAESFPAPTAAQRQAWPSIVAGKSTLLLAPTGSGKTLAAFLAALDRLMFAPPAEQETPGVQVLYISPLKALGVDVDRNLRAPIAGIDAVAHRTGPAPANAAITVPRVGIRSGDTPQRERQQILRNPPEILITTPESLYLMLTGRAESVLRTVDTVIVDEIHVMAPTKRGVHLFLSLERLERLRRQQDQQPPPLQRIGLSATQRPLDEIARLLGGAEATADPNRPPTPRPVEIIDAGEPKPFDLRIEVPVEDMARLGQPSGQGRNTPTTSSDGGNVVFGADLSGPSTPSIWPAIHPRLLQLVREHRSTMIFVNSRRLAERLAQALNELATEDEDQPQEIALAHHGSIAKEKRAAIEDRLKRGQLPAIVATSSMELGIDMGAVDLVIQIEAPPTIASGMQRIGRSGHSVGQVSRGRIFPKYRGDLLACAAASGRMLSGQVEETFYPRNPVDLLAQQIVAIVSRGSIEVDELYATVRGAAPYAELPRSALEGVLDLLSGRYPSDEFAELKPRINWDRVAGVISPRRASQRLAILNGGTIPDRGLYGVFLAGDGPDATGGSRVGELDEEMVFETNPGDVFLLGASSWRVLDITRDRVIVAPAPGEPGRMPFWRGDAPGRPLEFGKAIGRLARELSTGEPTAMRAKLCDEHVLDEQAADNLLRYLQDQVEATGEPPSDRTIVIESFLDEIGDWRVCVLSPFGARVHTPWATAIAARLREEGHDDVDLSWGDDGMVFRLMESDQPPEATLFLPRSDEVEDLVTRHLGSTAVFAARFRENAARALLLPKRRPQGRTPLWLQRRKSADLLAVASRYPSFPILLETYRECLRDVFDLPGLVSLLADIERRAVRVSRVESQTPSPFASALLLDFTGNFLYEGDAPLAERRAAALVLDHAQLRELLGAADLRELLDSDAMDEVALERAKLDRPALRDADDAHDLLLTHGPLTSAEIARRRDTQRTSEQTVAEWIEHLITARRIIKIRLAGELRLAAAEDAARLRDALGVAPPAGLPTAFLEAVDDPLGDLIARYARTQGPFLAAEVASRLGLGEAPVRAKLQQLADAGRVVAGEFTHAIRGQQWCDTGVLRQIKRRSLAKLRKQVQAAPPEALARLLPAWQGVNQPRRGLDGLLDVVEQLQGAPLVASTLESEILPARLIDYQPNHLDELFHAGEVVWRGLEGLGTSDGRIALYLADHVGLLSPVPQEETEEQDPLEIELRQLLSAGALRFDEMTKQTGAFANDLLDGLWRLVWRGEVTNDTLAPVRSLLRQSSATSTDKRRGGRRRQAFRSRRRERLPGSEGRWSLVASCIATPEATTPVVTPTARQTALATQLVQRHGVLTRSAVGKEVTVGGFSGLYPVLKAMEESGRVRRGYFVEGLGGAQFAAAGADELLRARAEEDPPPAILLAATDPANAYGAALPWPDHSGGEADEPSARPQRAAGAVVVLHEGRLIGYVGRTGRRVLSFLPAEEPDRTNMAEQLAKALAKRAADRSSTMIETVDGVRVGSSILAQKLLAAGFAASSRGFVWRG